MDKKILYITIVIVTLILLGGTYPKISLSIAGLIFFGAVLFNVDKYQELLS